MPEYIRQVITLGSPFRGEEPIGSHASGPYERLSHRHVPVSELPPAEEDRLPLNVPLTAVYSKGDGIVAWQSCVHAGGIDQESVEVVGSHCGLGHNPAAMWIVADRLARPSACGRRSCPRHSRSGSIRRPPPSSAPAEAGPWQAASGCRQQVGDALLDAPAEHVDVRR